MTERPTRRWNWKKLATFAVFGLCVLAAMWAIAGRRDELAHALGELNVIAVLGSLAFGLLGVLAMFMSWLAAVTDGGVSLSVRQGLRIYGIGQIGKYLPGSVWPVLTQAQLGRRHGISPLRMATGALLALAVSIVAGLIFGGVLLPFSAGSAARKLWWAPVVAVPMALVLLPPVLNRLVVFAARILRRGEVESGYTLPGIGRCAAWATLGNLFLGLHIFCLGHALGASGVRGYLLCVCAYTLAASVGVLVIFAPAGAGVREAVITAILAPVLTVDAALAIALVSRVILIVLDLLVAGSQVRGLRAAENLPGESIGSP